MALKATIFKADLQISDMDRHYYQNHNLILARHPSETDERLMVRILAFAMFAHENLQFSKGLSTDDEPELWQRSLSDEIELWIDLGQLDEKRIRKASSRAKKVCVYTYQERSATVWWQQIENKVQRFSNLQIIHLPDDASKSLASLCNRNMELQCNIQDGQIWLSDDQNSVHIIPVHWKQ